MHAVVPVRPSPGGPQLTPTPPTSYETRRVPDIMPLASLALEYALACRGRPETTTDDSDAPSSMDADGDGYEANHGDCDDADAAIHPDILDVCDGVDNDCDRQVDEDPDRAGYLDQDGDGHGSGTRIESCSEELATTTDDCDDGNPSVYPGAREVCDAMDEDCDGSVADCTADMARFAIDGGAGYGDYLEYAGDVDGDGLGDILIGSTGDTSFDTPSAVTLVPGRALTTGTVLLEDVAQVQFLAAPYVLVNPAYEYPLSVVRPMGDFDGDGAGDLVLATTAGLGVFTSSTLRLGGVLTWDDADIRLLSGADSEQPVPHGVAADLDDDGFKDVAFEQRVGATEVSRVLLARDAKETGATPDDASIAIAHTPGNSRQVWSDLDADGVADLVALRWDSYSRRASGGTVYVHLGGNLAPGIKSDADADATISRDLANEVVLQALPSVDVDSDGKPELILLDASVDGDELTSVEESIFHGASSAGAFTLQDRDVAIVDADPYYHARSDGSVPDLDGDGRGELAVAFYDRRNADPATGITVFVGADLPDVGVQPLTEGTLMVYSGKSYQQLTHVAEFSGDVDGNGVSDLLCADTVRGISYVLLWGDFDN